MRSTAAGCSKCLLARPEEALRRPSPLQAALPTPAASKYATAVRNSRPAHALACGAPAIPWLVYVPRGALAKSERTMGQLGPCASEQRVYRDCGPGLVYKEE